MKSLAIKAATCLALLVSMYTWAESNDLTGTWVIDVELTEELQPPIKKNRGVARGLRGFIAGGGVIAPVPGGSAPAVGAAGLKTPVVLHCSELTLSKDESKITIECANGTEREFNVGNLHGRKTNWKKNRLTESYRSTSRSVRHQFKIDRKGNLIATITIQPKGGVSQKYVRAFNRKPEDHPESNESEVAATDSS
ncbi:MAG: hypothetical protein OXG24_03780 [Gammaproteobacteria bacterium]|nr:hypothetical protein [Gammaproteobacteria bacterium]